MRRVSAVGVGSPPGLICGWRCVWVDTGPKKKPVLGPPSSKPLNKIPRPCSRCDHLSFVFLLGFLWEARGTKQAAMAENSSMGCSLKKIGSHLFSLNRSGPSTGKCSFLPLPNRLTNRLRWICFTDPAQGPGHSPFSFAPGPNHRQWPCVAILMVGRRPSLLNPRH